MKPRKFFLITAMICMVFISPFPSSAQGGQVLNKETVYVPAYSSIFHGDLNWELNLTVTLSIHNIDLKNNITIDSVVYYNTEGKVIHSYIGNEKVILNPLGTYNIGIRESDNRGGVGANFIVKWHSKSKVNRPVIETIMIGTKGQQGISFTSRGVTVAE